MGKEIPDIADQGVVLEGCSDRAALTGWLWLPQSMFSSRTFPCFVQGLVPRDASDPPPVSQDACFFSRSIQRRAGYRAAARRRSGSAQAPLTPTTTRPTARPR